MNESPRRIGLVLGGGGGKGAAHIGVLHILETLQLPVDVVAGTSIGGIVAALYASSYSPDEIEEWFHLALKRGIWGRDPTNTGLLGTRKIEAILQEALGDRTFADTRLPLALVAADLRRGREVILREGPLVDAVLASTALPGVFPPVLRGDAVLVDGGVLNNVPVDVVQVMGAGRVIAVDLTTTTEPFAYEELTQPEAEFWSLRRWLPHAQLTIAERALGLMVARISAVRLAQTPPEVLLRPDVGSVQLLDFTQTTEGRQEGERVALAQRSAIDALRDWRLADGEAEQEDK
jgi:NTE family protein